MTSKSDFRVDGLTEVLAALTRIGLDVEDPQAAMRDIAAEGARQVASAAPRRTGALAGSARPEVTKGRASVAVSVPYAGVINYGWPAHNIDPAGYLQVADAPTSAYALRRLETYINSTIRQRGVA